MLLAFSRLFKKVCFLFGLAGTVIFLPHCTTILLECPGLLFSVAQVINLLSQSLFCIGRIPWLLWPVSYLGCSLLLLWPARDACNRLHADFPLADKDKDHQLPLRVTLPGRTRISCALSRVDSRRWQWCCLLRQGQCTAGVLVAPVSWGGHHRVPQGPI